MSSSLPSDPVDVLVFQLGDETYGLPLLSVQEILAYRQPRRLPVDDPGLLGLIDLRGDPLAVMETRALMGLPAIAIESETVIIVVDLGSRRVGFLVDRVCDVASLKSGELKDVPVGASNPVSRLLRGAAKLADATLLLLDPQALTASGKTPQAEQAASESIPG